LFVKGKDAASLAAYAVGELEAEGAFYWTLRADYGEVLEVLW
jgi:hypothetical protein